MVSISNNVHINQPPVKNIILNQNEKTQNSFQSANLIDKYLANLAMQNRPVINTKPIFTPAFDGYNNMLQKDINGNTVQEVKYSKDGNKITETNFVRCYDGSIFNKIMTRDGNKKTMEIDFKDKDGNTLIQESRTYEKIDDDTAISTHNGKEYRISGLKGNILTIEHDGQKHVVDFDKKINAETEKITEEKTGNKITPSQKEFLISRIKNRPGDLILTFDKAIDSMTYLDIADYEGFYNNRVLKTSPKADSALELHELGHGVNDNAAAGKARWSDNNPEYILAREQEINNYNNVNKDDDMDWRMQKFTTCDYFVKDGWSKEAAKQEGADEEFAETYSYINNMDIEDVNYRTTSLIQFMPKSVAIAYNAFKN